MLFYKSCNYIIQRGRIFSRVITDTCNHRHQNTNKRLLSAGQEPHDRSPSNWKNNGTPEIIIGVTILSLLGIDRYLQSRQDENRRLLMSKLQAVIRDDEMNEMERNQKNMTDLEMKEMKCLFSCTVRRLPKYFDGSKCLMGVKVGDEVSVLEENVGPDGTYHLCRLERNDNTAVSIGWFPISCLEKRS